jgi:hypothetical protein
MTDLFDVNFILRTPEGVLNDNQDGNKSAAVAGAYGWGWVYAASL